MKVTGYVHKFGYVTRLLTSTLKMLPDRSGEIAQRWTARRSAIVFQHLIHAIYQTAPTSFVHPERRSSRFKRTISRCCRMRSPVLTAQDSPVAIRPVNQGCI